MIKVYGLDGSVYVNSLIFEAPTTPLITSFMIGEVEADIEHLEGGNTITASLPYGTDLTNITPVVTLGGTAVSFTPEGAQDFSEPVIYKAFDANGTETSYMVTFTVEESLNEDATLESATIDGNEIAFDENNSYEYVVPFAYSGVPQVEAEAAHPLSAVVVTQAEDVPGVATIKVTPQAGDSKAVVYTVNISRTPASDANYVTSYKLGDFAGTINNENNTIDITLVTGTDIAAEEPVVTVSSLATLTSASTSQVVVTSESGLVNTYAVNITYSNMSLSTFPYSTTMLGSEFVAPDWIIGGEGYNASYQREYDKSVLGAYRISKVGGTSPYMIFRMDKCGDITVHVTASGGRDRKSVV